MQQSEAGRAAQDFLVPAESSQTVKRLKLTSPLELLLASVSCLLIPGL